MFLKLQHQGGLAPSGVGSARLLCMRIALPVWCAILTALHAPSAHAHAVFAAPKTYRNPSFELKIDMRPQVEAYVRLGEGVYADAAAAAQQFDQTVREFLDDPTQENLELARKAWIAARQPYRQSEIFRFNDSPIDAPATADRPEGPETRINSWPVNEAGIDSVKGAPKSGIIHAAQPITEALLLSSNRRDDETDITLGWHAIEFLLWGQDFNADGPGQRPASDFLPGNPSRDNRRSYLRLASSMLVRDLQALAEVWRRDSANSYAQQLLKMDSAEVMGRALQGVTSLVAIELAGERLAVALDSGSQEDEHSCFSDTTHLDLQGDVQGVANFLYSSYQDESLGSSFLDLIRWKSPVLGRRLEAAMVNAKRHAAGLHVPFDALLGAVPDSPERLQAEATVTAMHDLALALKASAELLGLQIVIPGV